MNTTQQINEVIQSGDALLLEDFIQSRIFTGAMPAECRGIGDANLDDQTLEQAADVLYTHRKSCKHPTLWSDIMDYLSSEEVE